MPVGGSVKVDAIVDGVDDLPQQHAALHILVEVGKHGADNGLSAGGAGQIQILQCGKEAAIDKLQQLIARQGLAVLGIDRPVAPLVLVGYDGMVVIIGQGPFHLLLVIHFQKEEPHHLLNALGVAADAGILPHDVLQCLYYSVICHILCLLFSVECICFILFLYALGSCHCR